MPRFGIRWLLFFILVVAVLLNVATYDTQNAYFIACITLPCFFALTAKFGRGASNAIAIIVVMLSAVIFGSLLMAYGSYYHTFTKPSVGILVGGGWGSVFASSIIGAIVGVVMGLISTLLFLMVTACIPAQYHYQKSEAENRLDNVDRARDNRH